MLRDRLDGGGVETMGHMRQVCLPVSATDRVLMSGRAL